MLDALDRNFPKDYKWSRPDGGMFIWVEGPEGSDIEKIYWKAIEKKVAFVPGRFFYTQKGKGLGTMRLNYTMCEKEVLTGAIKILSEVIANENTAVQ